MMKILVAWDDPNEAELMSLYLNGENDLRVVGSPEEMLEHARTGAWDVVLMSLCYPSSVDGGFDLFCKLQNVLSGVPIVVAARPSEMIALPRLMTRGLRFNTYRDPQGDFIFLLLQTIESAIGAVKDEEEKKLAEQLREEINGVRLLQEAIIPRGLNPPGGYKAAARYEPSQITSVGGKAVTMAGGDYYDLFNATDHTLVALVGDASGHGLKACMSIMTMHTLVRMVGQARFDDAAGFVTEINGMLCSNSIVQSGGGFITLLYAALDTLTHKVSWASAGHPPALLHNLATNEVTQMGANNDGGLPLGIADGMPYESFEFHVPSRCRLLLYTDGLTDPLLPAKAKAGSRSGCPGSAERCKLAAICPWNKRSTNSLPLRASSREERAVTTIRRRYCWSAAIDARGRRSMRRPLHADGASQGVVGVWGRIALAARRAPARRGRFPDRCGGGP